MSIIKRLSICLLCILFILGIADDLSRKPSAPPQGSIPAESSIDIAHIKIEPGDTVLSVTEELNELSSLDIPKIIADFKQLNPGEDPDSLVPNSFYYFPLYNDF